MRLPITLININFTFHLFRFSDTSRTDEVLYSKALEYAGLTGTETVFDLYCGIGTISLFLSEKAGKVYGVEVVEDAIRDAQRNAEANGVENVEFIAGETEKVIPKMYSLWTCFRGRGIQKVFRF